VYTTTSGTVGSAGGGATLAMTGGGNSLTVFFVALACAAVGFALFNLAPRIRRGR